MGEDADEERPGFSGEIAYATVAVLRGVPSSKMIYRRVPTPSFSGLSRESGSGDALVSAWLRGGSETKRCSCGWRLITSAGESVRIWAPISFYARDAENGCPWLDVEEILPGQDWDSEIRSAIEKSRYVLVCLSHASLTKRGYVQKELRKALDLADEQPEDTMSFFYPDSLNVRPGRVWMTLL